MLSNNPLVELYAVTCKVFAQIVIWYHFSPQTFRGFPNCNGFA